MLAVFYGSDQIKVRAEVHKYIDNIIKADQTVIRIENDNYASGQLVNFANSSVLFGTTPVYLIDTLSTSADSYQELLDNLELLATSPYEFVVIERALKAADKKQFAKHTTEIYVLEKGESLIKFNIFSMAEALINRDKRQLWVLLQEAKHQNLSAEEIIGTLWWQLKILRLALYTKSADEAGVKDFPYNKAKRALKNFKDGEIETLSFKLLNLYHEGHAGKKDIDLALEEWVLRGN